jgi:hypothetical protein
MIRGGQTDYRLIMEDLFYNQSLSAAFTGGAGQPSES